MPTITTAEDRVLYLGTSCSAKRSSIVEPSSWGSGSIEGSCWLASILPVSRNNALGRRLFALALGDVRRRLLPAKHAADRVKANYGAQAAWPMVLERLSNSVDRFAGDRVYLYMVASFDDLFLRVERRRR